MRKISDWLRAAMGGGPPIESAASLRDFMDSRAAFIAQKCVVEFCRVRSGIQWTKLFRERVFLEALEASRWTSYGAALAQMAEMIAGALLTFAGPDRRRQLGEALLGLVHEIVEGHERNSGAPAAFGMSTVKLVERELQRSQLARPKPVRLIPEATFDIVFRSLPLFEIARGHDEDYVLNNLRMNLVAVHEEFCRRARMDELCAALLERAGSGQDRSDHL